MPQNARRTTTKPYLTLQAGHRCAAGEIVVGELSKRTGQTADRTRDAALTAIAQAAGFETLETRGNDWLDFQTIAAWQMKEALEAAFAAGRAAAAQP